MTNDTEARPDFKTRLSALRGDIASADWTDNLGIMKMGGAQIKYIALTQVKNKLAPLFSKNGLELKVDMNHPEPIGSPSAPSGWMVKLDVTIFDVYSDEELTYESYGYSSGDKAIQFATGHALKSMFVNNFLIADGIEQPYDDEIMVTNAYVPKTERAIDTAKADIKKASEKAIVPPKVATPAPAAEPKPVAKEPVAAAPATGDFLANISKVKRNTIQGILDSVKNKVDAGTATSAEYEKLLAEAKKITSEPEAAKWIIANRQ